MEKCTRTDCAFHVKQNTDGCARVRTSECIENNFMLFSPKDDSVNHPAHYTSHPSGVECIQITRWHNFNIGNVFKYCWRCGLKDNTKDIEDLEKARFYLDDEIARLKGIKEKAAQDEK